MPDLRICKRLFDGGKARISRELRPLVPCCNLWSAAEDLNPRTDVSLGIEGGGDE